MNSFPIPELSKNYLMSKVDERWNFLKKDCHILGYYLDPKLFGEKLTLDEESGISDLLVAAIIPESPIISEANRQKKQSIENELGVY